MIVVSNATPLISLSLINQLGLLKTLYGQVYIPPAVYEEVVTKGRERPGAKEVAQADWIVVSEVPEIGSRYCSASTSSFARGRDRGHGAGSRAPGRTHHP
jgi:predicted nucleic acid-binding protein